MHILLDKNKYGIPSAAQNIFKNVKHPLNINSFINFLSLVIQKALYKIF